MTARAVFELVLDILVFMFYQTFNIFQNVNYFWCKLGQFDEACGLMLMTIW